jgi:hypothetical protein
MSYSQVFLENDEGEMTPDIELSNSWGTAAKIWSDLFDTYVSDRSNQYDNWMLGTDRLWKVVDDKRLPRFERLIMASTFDYCLIKRENFEEMAAYYRTFSEKYRKEGFVDHLPTIAERMEGLKDEPTVAAMGFYWTSVSDCLWWVYEGCSECEEREQRNYNTNQDKKHWYLFDEYGKEKTDSEEEKVEEDGEARVQPGVEEKSS